MAGNHQKMNINAIRLSRLGADGTPVASSATGALILCGASTFGWTYEIDSGADITERDGANRICVVRRYTDAVKRVNLTMELCTSDIRVFEMLELGQMLLNGGAAPMGYVTRIQSSCGTSTTKNGVLVETWSDRWECSQLSPTAPYFRKAFARTFWTPQGATLTNGVSKLQFSGFGLPNAKAGDGPFNDFPSDLAPITDWIDAEWEDTTLPTCPNPMAYTATPAGP